MATQEKQLEAQVDRQGALPEMVQSITAFCQRVQAGLANATFAQKRTLVELLIDRVLVANGEVEIRYALPTHPRSETTRFCHVRQDYLHKIVEVLHLADDDRRAVFFVIPLDGGSALHVMLGKRFRVTVDQKRLPMVGRSTENQGHQRYVPEVWIAEV